MNVHTRICPLCQKEVIHKNELSCRQADRNKRSCYPCAMEVRKLTDIKGKYQYPKRNLKGQIFGNWEVLSLSHRESAGIWCWNVRCNNCGLEVKRSTSYVKKSKSCTCCGLKTKGESGLNKIIGSYTDSAKKRNLNFSLTKEQFRNLTSSSCYYCGCLPKIKKIRKYKDNRSSWGDYSYNGIDRINNNSGYTIDNCVACCRTCNRGKGAWSFEFWISYLKQFAENLLNNKIPCLQEPVIIDDFKNLYNKKIF